MRFCTMKSVLMEGVAEWLKAPDSKSGVVARLPWVRIPPLPPVNLILIIRIFYDCAKRIFAFARAIPLSYFLPSSVLPCFITFYHCAASIPSPHAAKHPHTPASLQTCVATHGNPKSHATCCCRGRCRDGTRPQ